MSDETASGALVYVVYNVGVRDLRYNVGSTEQPDFRSLDKRKDQAPVVAKALGMSAEEAQLGTRPLSKVILRGLNSGDTSLDLLRFPILKPALEYVLLQQSHIDLLSLVVTDQDEKTYFAIQDTVHVGEILKYLVGRYYQGKVAQVKSWSVSKRPSEDASASRFSKRLLAQVIPEGEVTVYAFTSAGIPAINNALKDQLVLMAAERSPQVTLHLHRVRELPEEDLRRGRQDGPIVSDSVPIFLRDLLNQAIKTLIKRYDYRGALVLMEGYGQYGFWDIRLQSVLQHAAARVNVNFPKAVEQLTGLGNNEPIKSWREQTQSVKRQDAHLRRLVEFYFIARTYYEDDAYADVLWSVATFYENAFKVIISSVLKLNLGSLQAPVIWRDTLTRSGKKKLVDYFAGLSGKTAPSKQHHGSMQGWAVNRRFFNACADYINTLDGMVEAKRALLLLQSLDGLYNLRNDSIHSLVGVSRRLLESKFQPLNDIASTKLSTVGTFHDPLNQLLPTLHEIITLVLRSLGKEELIDRNPYGEINGYITELLQRDDFDGIAAFSDISEKGSSASARFSRPDDDVGEDHTSTDR